MNKKNLLLSFVIILALILSSFGNLVYAAAGSVSNLSASYSQGIITVSGSGNLILKNIVIIEVLKPNNELLYFGTASLNNKSSFTEKIQVGSLDSGTYRVRSADYDGGPYSETTFTIGFVDDDREPSSPGRGPTTGVTDSGPISFPAQAFSNFVQELLDEAEENSITNIEIELDIGFDKDTKDLDLVLTRANLDDLRAHNIGSLTINTPFASISLDRETLDGLDDEDLYIHMAYVGENDPSDNSQITNRPVYEFTVRSGDRIVRNFVGNITISIPYNPSIGESPDALVVYHVGEDGRYEILVNSYYDPIKNLVVFRTNHFSKFAIAHNKVNFLDVFDHDWYSKAVTFISARNITKGTGENKYSPMTNISRADFLVMLMRAYKLEPTEDYSSDNFIDGGATYYSPYLSLAKKMGLAQGVGNNLFLPEKEITRQEMFSLVYKILQVLEELPENKTNIHKAFSDTDSISDWAKAPIEYLVSKGIVSGKGDKLDPLGQSTRGEMAQLLYNILQQR